MPIFTSSSFRRADENGNFGFRISDFPAALPFKLSHPVDAGDVVPAPEPAPEPEPGTNHFFLAR